jgi:hypothetical protein
MAILLHSLVIFPLFYIHIKENYLVKLFYIVYQFYFIFCDWKKFATEILEKKNSPHFFVSDNQWLAS